MLPLDLQHKDRITARLKDGDRIRVIAELEGVTRQTVHRIVVNLKKYGSHTAPKKNIPMGRLPSIPPKARAALVAYMRAQPWMFLEEMEYYLLDRWGLSVSPSTISRTLKRMGLDRKEMRRVASDGAKEERDAYLCELRNFTHEQLVFVGESSANEHNEDRRRGWDSYGLSRSVKKAAGRDQRFSVVPAYCSDGILASYVHLGDTAEAGYLWFLENELLPRCSRFPGPKSVLVLDKTAIHHSKDVRLLCRGAGVRLVYLPACSPECNPNEELFTLMKAWLKRQYTIADNFETINPNNEAPDEEKESFESLLTSAMYSCGQARFAEDHFRHVDVYIPDREEGQIPQNPPEYRYSMGLAR